MVSSLVPAPDMSRTILRQLGYSPEISCVRSPQWEWKRESVIDLSGYEHKQDIEVIGFSNEYKQIARQSQESWQVGSSLACKRRKTL